MAVIFIVGLACGYFIPRHDSEYAMLVKTAKLQAVKIAVIEQESKLNNYITQLKKLKNPKQLPPEEVK